MVLWPLWWLRDVMYAGIRPQMFGVPMWDGVRGALFMILTFHLFILPLLLFLLSSFQVHCTGRLRYLAIFTSSQLIPVPYSIY